MGEWFCLTFIVVAHGYMVGHDMYHMWLQVCARVPARVRTCVCVRACVSFPSTRPPPQPTHIKVESVHFFHLFCLFSFLHVGWFGISLGV